MKTKKDIEKAIDELTTEYQTGVRKLAAEKKLLPNVNKFIGSSIGLTVVSLISAIVAITAMFSAGSVAVISASTLLSLCTMFPAGTLYKYSNKLLGKSRTLDKKEKDLWDSFCEQRDIYANEMQKVLEEEQKAEILACIKENDEIDRVVKELDDLSI